VGPIFTKELRTASRRRRYYALRTAFVAFLVFFLSSIWFQAMRPHARAIEVMARMSGASKSVTSFVIWFEFIACQMIAVVSLSTAISDEITRRTLGVLMTTPVTSLQIVVGKLLSRLLQICLLLGVTLPILALVRVFGGVPWGYLVSGLTLILCRCLFVGSLSLLFSIYARRAYVAIAATVLTLVLLDGILPGVVAVYFHRQIPEWVIMSYLNYGNSFAVLVGRTEAMMSPRSWLRTDPLAWLWHGLMLLGISVLLIGWAALRVRRVGLQLVTGAASFRTCGFGRSQGGRTRIRRVWGAPVLWKEMREPLLGRYRKSTLALLALILTAMVFFYAGMTRHDQFSNDDTQIMFGLMLVGIGLFYSAIIPATVISKEKESRAWPILLSTTLTPWQILTGKWWGSFLHSLPAWSLLVGHMVLFTLVRVIHPWGLPLLSIALAGPIVFLLGSGLFLSVRFRNTTAAVIANLLLALTIWALAPMAIGFLFSILDVSYEFFELAIGFNPLVQVVVILERTAHGWRDLRSFGWPLTNLSLNRTLALLFFSSLLYSVAGGMFMVISRKILRSRIF
jgi:ABC-type transport system involved in multi-copper enzyme maturation permease subunit